MLIQYRVASSGRIEERTIKFLSVNNIVIAAANTGRDSNKRIAVINTDQTNNGMKLVLEPGTLVLITVAMKFMAPRIEDIPAKCRLGIAKSTEHLKQ